MLIRSGECNQCGECCKTVNITAVRDVTLRQHGSLKELELYLSYRGIRVAGEDVKKNQLFYSMGIPCKQLGPENQCQAHARPEEKPLLCHRYPQTQPDVEGCGYWFEGMDFLGTMKNDRR